MSTQIFKKNVPNELIFNLLDSICLKNEKHYVFNIDSFKKGVFKESIQKFIRLQIFKSVIISDDAELTSFLISEKFC